jgi:carbonic anhydrase
MPFDFNAAVRKQYNILPVSPSLIESQSSAKQHILWVGCSDSLVSETDSLDVDREEIFVHRNLGNLLSNGDLSSQSAIAWAVDLLKVSGECCVVWLRLI